MRLDLLAAAFIAAGALVWPVGLNADDSRRETERIVAFGKVFKIPTPQAVKLTTEEVCGTHERVQQARCREAFEVLARALTELRALLTSPRAAFAAPVAKSEDTVPSDVRGAGRRVAVLTSWINEQFGPKR
jgi:hypothetical protein